MHRDPPPTTGTPASWNDSRGFGFIEGPDGRRLFAHVSDFPSGRRPAVGHRVSFVVGRDRSGRPCATRIRYVGRGPRRRPRAGGPPVAEGIAAFFLLLVVVLAVDERVPVAVPLVYAVLSVVAALLHADDKAAARSGRRRTPESTLHLVGLLGGWPGALVAMRRLRHKTAKASFQATFWITVAVNGAALTLLVLSGTTLASLLA